MCINEPNFFTVITNIRRERVDGLQRNFLASMNIQRSHKQRRVHSLGKQWIQRGTPVGI